MKFWFLWFFWPNFLILNFISLDSALRYWSFWNPYHSLANPKMCFCLLTITTSATNPTAVAVAASPLSLLTFSRWLPLDGKANRIWIGIWFQYCDVLYMKLLLVLFACLLVLFLLNVPFFLLTCSNVRILFVQFHSLCVLFHQLWYLNLVYIERAHKCCLRWATAILFSSFFFLYSVSISSCFCHNVVVIVVTRASPQQRRLLSRWQCICVCVCVRARVYISIVVVLHNPQQ